MSKTLNAWLISTLLLLGSLPAVASDRYDTIIRAQADSTGVPALMIKAVIRTESAFKPRAVSHAGAMGLMQLMPATASRFGVNNPFDPQQNINAGSRYLKWLYQRYQDWPLALAAYNSGEGTVDRYQGIPPYRETRNYVRKVLEAYQRLSGRTIQAAQPALSTSTPQANIITHQSHTGSNSENAALLQEMLVTALSADSTVQWTPPPDYYSP